MRNVREGKAGGVWLEGDSHADDRMSSRRKRGQDRHVPVSLLAQQAGRACPDPESGDLTDGPRDRAGGPNHSKGTSEQNSSEAAESRRQQGAELKEVVSLVCL